MKRVLKKILKRGIVDRDVRSGDPHIEQTCRIFVARYAGCMKVLNWGFNLK